MDARPGPSSSLPMSGKKTFSRQELRNQDHLLPFGNDVRSRLTNNLSQNTCKKRKIEDLREQLTKRFKNERTFESDVQALSERSHKNRFENDRNSNRKNQEWQSHRAHSGVRKDLAQSSRDEHHDRRQNANSSRADPCRNAQRDQFISIAVLERIAKTYTEHVFLKLNEHKEGFMNMLNSPIRQPDTFILVLEILSKVSRSPFEELKYKLILDVCNSDFPTNIRNYLIDLPYAENKHQNILYWKNQEGFWRNFITFCTDIMEISPDTAVKKCRALIENISKTCLEFLNQRHSFALSEEDSLRLEELRNKLALHADGNKLATDAVNVSDVDMKPPEDFRELSVVPTREDLLDSQPFLRPNIVDGGYSDVEHYLDVQFRLLREDCFGPIRIGIRQYLADPNKRKYDHIRIYRDVKFIGPYVSNLKVGHLIQIDVETNHYLKRINWARSKRCMFGSLVILTKDHCLKDVIVATILDRDNTLLAMGKLPISVINTSSEVSIRDGDNYTMVESEVYFEAYYHVLKALQAVSLRNHLAMQQYIVQVNPKAAIPNYLTKNSSYAVTSKGSTVKFNVLDPNSWPTKEKLQFNKSQYDAYKLALTHELAVIQGPPGTGKTYVGLKVAKTLLQNVKAERNCCLMLVICYTNHALDQFLEELSNITTNIVRIGSQSRNKAMEQFNLVNLRRNQTVMSSMLFKESKDKLRQSIDDFQEALLLLDILNYGIVHCKALEEEIPQFAHLCNYYRQLPSIKDPLMHWLFENNAEYYVSLNECLTDFTAFNVEDDDGIESDNIRARHNIILDDNNEKNTRLAEAKRRYTSFSLIDATISLRDKVSEYEKNTPRKFKDKLYAEMAIRGLNAKINQFKAMMKYRSKEINLYVDDTTNFSRILPQDRWRLYFMWIKDKVNQVKNLIRDYQASVSPEATVYEETRMLMDIELLRSRRVEVLGMTTSGAARMRKLLQAISPKIVIVEEAAEVLEQHIITSLTKSCQHLILIGDHQQLRPSASYMKLAKQYNIEVSLFERMITNGIHSRRLRVQHRMRPEIAALIAPHIYPDLENHPTVENFGDVPGFEKNLFFFSHEHQEEVHPNDTTSKTNPKEADMILALANYLIQQGCTSDDVTILATYSGQMFYMRKERQNYPRLSNVKITVVDNYQGEESKIILLSLVRNNPDNNIGFLGIKNRICVALSRAKQGLYIFGNVNMLKAKSELWRKIADTLESTDSVGTTLKLKCQVHLDEITLIQSAEDFSKVPEGGCSRKCNYQYSCGHFCPLYCHGYDREHLETKCTKKCERALCDQNHICPLKCWQDCGQCQVLVKKTLPCGHDMKVFCYREPEDPRNQCLEEKEVVLPICGHKAKIQCSMDINKAKCKEKCRLRLEECGHVCERRCHIAFSDHSDYLCTKNCNRTKKGCQAKTDSDLTEHKCMKKCFERCDDCNVQIEKTRSSCGHTQRVACCVKIDDTLCKKKCARKMTCGHRCRKLCHEECGGCNVLVTKVIPDCNHKIKIECKTGVSRALCYEKCPRTLSCGHACTQRCGVECDRALCAHLSTAEVDAPCGHKVRLPCNVYTLFNDGFIASKELVKFCNEPCNEELACSHICRGTCSQCHQGRLHVPCKQTCNQINICGHQCQEPCNQICPPCNFPCEVQCSHSRCSRICGRPCVPCKEKCDRRCPHGVCTRLCSETCSRAACSEACARELPCGHRCRGVCGEPCPDVCRDCSPDTFPTDFLGDPYDDHDKFILLQDCGHVLILEDMDILMMGDRDNIQIRQCPFCRKPIINTNRYKDLVNNMFKNEINPIKERVYGRNSDIYEKKKELRNKIASIHKKCSTAHPGLSTTLRNFITFVDSLKKKYLLLVEMLIIYCNLIEMVTECWIKFQQNNTTILKEDMETNIVLILHTLQIDLGSKVPIKISEQQQKDIGNEIKRLNSIAQLASLLAISKHVTIDSNLKSFIETAEKAVLILSVFDEEKAIESLTVLQKELKSSVNVTKMERAIIVKAVGLKAGHWYKCPNGHFYCIAQCGGAIEVSKCADCGAAIGGTHHALLADNAHAPEMDGSAYPAYSEAANNMANFIINN